MTKTLENMRINDKELGWGTVTYVSKSWALIVWDSDLDCSEQIDTATLMQYIYNMGKGDTYTAERILEELEANNWEDTTFYLADGSETVVSPCMYGEGDSRTCDYFLVHHSELPWLSTDSAKDLANTFNNICNIRNEQYEDEKKLHEYYAKYSKLGWPDGSADFYSDWHKDVYGYRPRSW